MSSKIVKEYEEDGVVVKEGANQPFALVSLNTMKSIVTSLQDAEACVSKINQKEASIALGTIRERINPVLVGLENAARDLGVEIQIANPEFEYERARKELELAMAQLKAMENPDGPDVA